MSARHSFARGVVLAAAIAAAWLPWAVLAGPVIGARAALPLFLAAAAAVYVAALSPRRGHGAVAGALAFAAAMALVILPLALAELAVGLALLVGVARCLLYPAAPARLLAREALLLVAGLLFALFLARPSLVPIALALWGFLLVQSLFFLGGGAGLRHTRAGDAFEEAHRRAMALLERENG